MVVVVEGVVEGSLPEWVVVSLKLRMEQIVNVLTRASVKGVESCLRP